MIKMETNSILMTISMFSTCFVLNLINYSLMKFTNKKGEKEKTNESFALKTKKKNQLKFKLYYYIHVLQAVIYSYK